VDNWNNITNSQNRVRKKMLEVHYNDHLDKKDSESTKRLKDTVVNCVATLHVPKVNGTDIQIVCTAQTQRQETLDLPYLTLLCDNFKNRMFLQNFFS
jgi:hypothetical protein